MGRESCSLEGIYFKKTVVDGKEKDILIFDGESKLLFHRGWAVVIVLPSLEQMGFAVTNRHSAVASDDTNLLS